MTTRVKHHFSTAKADGPDSTFVKPSDWNADHDLESDSSAFVLGRDTSGSGDLQELPISVAPDQSVTVFGKSFTPAAGSTANRPAVGTGGMIRWNTDLNVLETFSAGVWVPILTGTAIPVGGTIGWYSNTLPAGGWLFVNGQTIGSGASAADNADDKYQALYNFLWTNVTVLAVTGGRGASASADWTANKPLALPDECGRVTAGMDTMGGVATKNRLKLADNALGVDGTVLGASGGEQLHTIVIAEMPKHHHVTPTGSNTGNTAFGGGGLPILDGGSNTFDTGGDGPHNNVQPTIIKNTIIKF